MIKYTLFVGLNDKDKKIQLVDNEAARAIITRAALANGIDGLTITLSQGIYKHESGAVVIENTYRLELLFVKDSQVRALCDDLKKLLNQESIAIQIDKIESELY